MPFAGSPLLQCLRFLVTIALVSRSHMLVLCGYNFCDGAESGVTPMPVRRCHVCGIGKPLTTEYFQGAPYFAKGFSFYCNTSDAESRPSKQVALKKFEIDFIPNEQGKHGGKG